MCVCIKDADCVIEKIISSLPAKFNFVVCAIEDSKDSELMTID